MNHRHPKLIVALLAACGGISSAGADDIYWVGYQNSCMVDRPDNGSFFHGDNWLNFLVPETGDSAIFGAEENPGGNLGYPHVVHFGDFCVDVFACPNASLILAGDASIDHLEIQDGSFIFDMGPGSTPGGNCTGDNNDYGSLTSGAFYGLTVGTSITRTSGGQTGQAGDALLTIRNGTLFTFGTSIGADGDGEIIVTGPGAVLDNFAAEMAIGGYNGTGILRIENGGSIENRTNWVKIARNASATGHVVVSNSTNPASFQNTVIGQAGLGTFTIEDGGKVLGNLWFMGSVEGAHGDMLISGSGSELILTSAVSVGQGGSGSFTIENGGHCSTPSLFNVPFMDNSSGIAGTGTTVVTGENSLLEARNLYVGRPGHGTVNVTDNGRIELTGSCYLANDINGLTGSFGRLDLTNGGALDTGSIFIGTGGTGELNIQSGGHAHTRSHATIGSNETAIGSVSVDGIGSILNASTDLLVGKDGTGVLTICNGGSVVSGDDAFFDFSDTSDATLIFGIGNNGPGSLDIVGNLSIGESSTLEITLDPGIVPADGQEYVVVTAGGGITGVFTDEILPAEAEGVPLAWTVHYNATDITLSVVHIAPCDPDLNHDGLLDLFDVTTFLEAFAANEAAGDFNNDGLWDFFDIISYLQAFSAGCP